MGRHKKEPRPCANPQCGRVITTRRLCPRCQKRKQRGRLLSSKSKSKIRKEEEEETASIQKTWRPLRPKPTSIPFAPFPFPMGGRIKEVYPINNFPVSQAKTLEKIGKNVLRLLGTLPPGHHLRMVLEQSISPQILPHELPLVGHIPDWSNSLDNHMEGTKHSENAEPSEPIFFTDV